jgi:putative Holliday junction resolvase
VLALDYGSVHTGAAISDPSATIVRPLPEIKDAAQPEGLASIVRLVSEEGAGLIVVGMPVSLSGELGEQAQETERFVEALTREVDVPVVSFDERFTSTIAGARGRYSSASEHSLAAAVLLEDFLGSSEYRSLT